MSRGKFRSFITDEVTAVSTKHPPRSSCMPGTSVERDSSRIRELISIRESHWLRYGSGGGRHLGFQLKNERTRDLAVHKDLTARLKTIKEDVHLDADGQREARIQANVDAIKHEDRLNQTAEAEREALRELGRLYRVPTYREFLLAEPQDANTKQILADMDRDGLEARKTEIADLSQRSPVLRDLRQLVHSRSRDGVVTYHLPNGRSFRDYGRRIDCDHADPQAIRAQLLLVARRFNRETKISGTQEFQETVLREAARLGIRVTNPELQQQYAEHLIRSQRAWQEQQAAHRQSLTELANRPIEVHADPKSAKAAFDTSLRSAVLAAARTVNPLVVPAAGVDVQLKGLFGSRGCCMSAPLSLYRLADEVLIETVTAEMANEFQSLDSAAVVTRDPSGAYQVNADSTIDTTSTTIWTPR